MHLIHNLTKSTNHLRQQVFFLLSTEGSMIEQRRSGEKRAAGTGGEKIIGQ